MKKNPLEKYGDQVFISHSSSDKDFVRRLAYDLKGTGLKVWFDEWELKVGDSLVNNISQAIISSGWFIIVLSKNSIDSKWVTRELNAAFSEEFDEKLKFLPCLIDDSTLPLFLRDKVYADFRAFYDIGYKNILKAILGDSVFEPTHWMGNHPAVVRKSIKRNKSRNGKSQGLIGVQKFASLFPGQPVQEIDSRSKWMKIRFFHHFLNSYEEGWVRKVYVRTNNRHFDENLSAKR